MKSYLLTIWLLFLSVLAFSQASQETFGKNRVQYKQFDWKFISTQHFHIYYYQEGANLAYNTARIAEEDYARISSLVGYYPFRKITLMVYNSPGDLRQSNIGIQDRAFVGGETRLIKSKKELAFAGNYVAFKQEISVTVADMLINSMLFGGSLKDAVQSSYLLHIPEWFVVGAAAYIGKGWDSKMDHVVRDLVVKNDFDPRSLIGDDAEIIGQSIWNYIALNYGETSVSSILNLSRITHSEQMSIESSLGVSYKDFLKEWQNYYHEQMPIDQLMKEPIKKQRVRRLNRRKYHYNGISYNPDSSLLAYSENFLGRERVSVLNLETGKKKLIYRKGNRLVDQKVDYSSPLVAWRSKQEISVLTYKRGTPYLFTKNIVTGKREHKYFNTFDQITSFDYNFSNNDMALAAYKNGQSDIYIYDYKEDKARRITKDLYDELDVRYQYGTSTIVFASNRLSDTIRKDNGEYETVTADYNIFAYDTEKKSPVLKRLVNLPDADESPLVLKNGDLFFLKNVKHNQQLFRLNILDSIYEQKTNFSGNITDVAISPDGNHLTYVVRNKGRSYLYVDSTFSPDSTYALYTRKSFEKPLAPKPEKTLDMLLSDIDLSLLTFGSDTVFTRASMVGEKTKDKGKYPDNKIFGPFPNRPQMGVDFFVTTLEIDQLRGAGAFIHASMSDMMANNKVNFEVFLMSNLRTSSFAAEYEWLKHREDFKFRYDRKSYFITDNEILFQNYTLNNFEVGMSHPFSEVSRVSFHPTYTNVRFTDYGALFYMPDSLNHYAGYKMEYVFDNTLEHGLNMLEGTRIKIQLSTNNFYGKRFEGDSSKRALGIIPGNSSKDFTKLNIDVRKYFKIYREMVFASRASLGQFFGPSRKNFLIGGMDNWLMASNASGRGTGPNPFSFNTFQNNSDILFADYATNLRGFRYNARYGYRYFLVNNEMRVPLAKIFHKGPMGSSFFRNLQVVSFCDFGTAWSKGNPFTTDNDINTQVIEQPESPFRATVTNYESPFLLGYGLGVRSMILGYYLKFDLAWGVQDFVKQGKEFYFTFGYDF